MRVVFAGTPAPALPSLRALLDSAEHEVLAVLTRPDAPAGRGRREAQSPVKAAARAAGIEVLSPPNPSDPSFLARLRELAPQACAVVAYGALIRPVALAIPAHGWLNVHFSLLPAWRGAAPVAHAILAGDDVTGVSVFRLDEGLDTGPVYGTTTTAVGPRETAGQLLERLAGDGAALLLATLAGVEAGRLTPLRQPEDGVSHAPKLTAADARIDWGLPAFAVDRRIRATTPTPGAWTTFRDKRLRLGPGEPLGAARLAPGELAVERERVLVGCAGGALALGEVAAQGRRPMPAELWARGARIAAEDRLV